MNKLIPKEFCSQLTTNTQYSRRLWPIRYSDLDIKSLIQIFKFEKFWILSSLKFLRSLNSPKLEFFASQIWHFSKRTVCIDNPVRYGRGAHFEKNVIRFGWVMDILNNFSWGFQKCKLYRRRTHPVDAQRLPTHPTYRLGYRLSGQSWCVKGVCLIKKSIRVLFLELKN